MDKQLERDRKIHSLLMVFLLILMMATITVVVVSVQGIPREQKGEAYVPESEAGEKKPLPDYMLDDIKPNELELLKP